MARLLRGPPKCHHFRGRQPGSGTVVELGGTQENINWRVLPPETSLTVACEKRMVLGVPADTIGKSPESFIDGRWSEEDVEVHVGGGPRFSGAEGERQCSAKRVGDAAVLQGTVELVHHLKECGHRSVGKTGAFRRRERG